MIDSAGVHVIQFEQPLEVTDTPVQPELVLRIGQDTSNPDGDLFVVEGAIRLSDGRIAVANAGTQQVKFFSAEGVFEYAVGRKGDGPDEFQRLDGIRRYGPDSIAVWDRGRRRAVILDGRGKLGRAFDLRRPNSTILGSFGDGSLLVSSGLIRMTDAAPGVAIPQVIDIILYEPAGTERMVVDSAIANRRIVRLDFPNGNVSFDEEIFGRHTSIAVGDSVYYIGLADDFVIRGYNRRGTLRSILRWPSVNVTVTSDDVEAFKAQTMQRAASEEDRAFQHQRLAQLPAATRLPAYSDLRVDEDGCIWIHNFAQQGRATSQTWTVLNSNTLQRQHVQFKPSVEVLDVRHGHILVLERDAMDVETIAEYIWSGA